MSFTFRRGASQDADGIVELTYRQEADDSVVRAGVEAALSEETKGRYYVAEKEGRLVAAVFVSCGLSHSENGPLWWVQQVSTSPEERNNWDFLDARFRSFVQETEKEHVCHWQLVGSVYTRDFVETCKRDGLESHCDIREELF